MSKDLQRSDHEEERIRQLIGWEVEQIQFDDQQIRTPIPAEALHWDRMWNVLGGYLGPKFGPASVVRVFLRKTAPLVRLDSGVVVSLWHCEAERPHVTISLPVWDTGEVLFRYEKPVDLCWITLDAVGPRGEAT